MVLARGSKYNFTGSVKFAIGICLTVFVLHLLIRTTYKVMRLFVASTKLKSSPKTNDMVWMDYAFGNWNLTSSACFCFRKSKVISVEPIWRARQVLEGCTAHARMFLYDIARL